MFGERDVRHTWGGHPPPSPTNQPREGHATNHRGWYSHNGALSIISITVHLHLSSGLHNYRVTPLSHRECVIVPVKHHTVTVPVKHDTVTIPVKHHTVTIPVCHSSFMWLYCHDLISLLIHVAVCTVITSDHSSFMSLYCHYLRSVLIHVNVLSSSQITPYSCHCLYCYYIRSLLTWHNR